MPIEQFHGALLHRSKRAETRANGQRARKMRMEQRELFDVARFITSDRSSAVQSHAGLDILRWTRLAHEPVPCITVSPVPVVVGVTVLVSLADHQPVVHDGLIRVGYEVLH